MLLLDSFEHNGPNGKHLVLVLEVMGPSTVIMENKLRDMSRISSGGPMGYPKTASKEISRQALLGVDYLHSNGITHGGRLPLDPRSLLLWPG